jgi:HD superfamily phosphohydrolase
MSGAKAIGNSICYPSKDAFTVYEFFSARFLMYKKIYNNVKTQIFDLMVRDALIEAEPVMKISEKVDSCEEYSKLTDYVTTQIKLSKDPALAKSQEIMDNISKRKNLYKHIGDLILTPEQVAQGKISEADVVNHCRSRSSNGNLRPEDIATLHIKNNYALGTKNPVDYVQFYDPSNPSKGSFNIDKSQVSLIVPDRF